MNKPGTLLVMIFVGLMLTSVSTLGQGPVDLTTTIPKSEATQVGIVVMHGKAGDPSGAIAPLVHALKKKGGFKVVAPHMTWSRSYDLSYEATMAYIHEQVTALRAQGAKHIFVGGHSIGANAALGYAARHHEIQGVVAIAPGHAIETGGMQDKFGDSLFKAEKLIKKGKGDKKSSFQDSNQGETSYIRTTPDIYLSWFSLFGPAPMPENLEKIEGKVPLLWIPSSEDVLARGKRYAFDRIKEHPLHAYVTVPGTHVDAPRPATPHVIAWINTVVKASKKP